VNWRTGPTCVNAAQGQVQLTSINFNILFHTTSKVSKFEQTTTTTQQQQHNNQQHNNNNNNNNKQQQ